MCMNYPMALRERSPVGRGMSVFIFENWSRKLTPSFRANLRGLQLSQSGAVTVPLVLLCCTFSLFGFGTWSLFRHERRTQELQLRLLDCVGGEALSLKALNHQIAVTNIEIRTTRVALAALGIEPSTQTLLREMLFVLTAAQDAAISIWKLRSHSWRLSRACRKISARAWFTEYPSPDWSRPPPDLLGPMPLEEAGQAINLFRFSIEGFQFGATRRAAAEVYRPTGKESLFDEGPTWSARWSPRNPYSGQISRSL